MRVGSFISALHFLVLEMIWVRAKEPMYPSSSFDAFLRLESQFAWNRQYYLGARSWITEKIHFGANSIGPFPYSLQSPVSRLSRLQ